MKKCVIMPLFGICGDGGSLGECAYRFADKAADCGAEYWLLPSLGENYAEAIDVDLLRMDGLVTDGEIKSAGRKRASRDEVLRKAFTRFWKPDSYAEFLSAQKDADSADEYELFLRYEFSMQYNALVGYALSRGVVVTDVMPADAQPVFVQ